MDKTYSVLREMWEENYSKWLPLKEENDRLVEEVRRRRSVVPILFANVGDHYYKQNMELIESIAEKLGYGEYEKEITFKWQEIYSK